MKKLLKGSKRGITFSFDSKNTNFEIGKKYRYIIEPKSKKIYIVSSPDDTPKALTVSKKKVGKKIKSLIDLRSKKIIATIKGSDFLEVTFEKDIIKVNVLKESITSKIPKIIHTNKVIDITKKLENSKVVHSMDISMSLLDKAVGDNLTPTYSINTSTYFEDKYIGKADKNLLKGFKRTIKVLSLFSGAGFFDYPLYLDKDFEIVKAIELSSSACNNYKENLKGVDIENKDIRDFKIKKDSLNIDLVYGGCPCTPYSNANRRKRLENHKDANLLDEYLRVVKISSPKCFVLENVPQFLSSSNRKNLEKIREQLPDYKISYSILEDSSCGGFTTRQRAFIFGSKIGNVAINFIKKKAKTVGMALKKVTSRWFNYNDYTVPSEETKERMSYIPQGRNWSILPKRLWQPSYQIGKTHSNTYRRLELNKPCCTLANFRKCNLIHPFKNRGLSIAEALALTGFDENFKLVGSLSAKQLECANGVPFALSNTVKNIIKNHLFKYFYNNVTALY